MAEQDDSSTCAGKHEKSPDFHGDEWEMFQRVIESHKVTLANVIADRDRYKAALEQIASDDDTHHDWWARDIALEALGKAGENG